MSADLPPGAITAAAKAISDAFTDVENYPRTALRRELATAVLEAAAPHLHRAEMELALAEVTSRESLGALVREVWIGWAEEQADPKPSWLTPWAGLNEGQREVDMRIGEAVAAVAVATERERVAAAAGKLIRDWRKAAASYASSEPALSSVLYDCANQAADLLTEEGP